MLVHGVTAGALALGLLLPAGELLLLLDGLRATALHEAGALGPLGLQAGMCADGTRRRQLGGRIVIAQLGGLQQALRTYVRFVAGA